MKKTFTLLKCLFAIILLIGINSLDSFSQEYVNGRLQGTFRVKIQPALGEAINITSTPGQTVKSGIQTMDVLSSQYSVSNMKRVFPVMPGFEEKMQKHGLHLWYEITIGAEVSTNEAITAYGDLVEIELAEPILEKSLIEPGTPRAISSPMVTTFSSTEPFNDPYLHMQWHYNNTGQTGGTVGADINLYDAWEITTGSSDIIVSIHDQGVDYDHEDLAGNMWVNEAELNGTANFDDDGNGYKDDIYGFNFQENSPEIAPGYHGTHVAGTVGAMNNNGKGVAGVAGGTDTQAGVKMISCQILGGVGSGNIPASFVYAANMGAVISQNSWGYSAPGNKEQAILDAIDYFIEEAGDYIGSPMKGGVVIFAAGNANYDGEWWPGYYEKCIAVSALDANFKKATYSNFGTWVDIAAPGGQWELDANMDEDQVSAGYSNGILSTLENNTYGYLDGTSMACPHVSGVAALMIANNSGENYTAEKLKSTLLTAFFDIDTVTANAEYKGKLGIGSVDALSALAQDQGHAPENISDLASTGLAQDFVLLEWSVPADQDDELPFYFEVLSSKEPISELTLEFAKSQVIRNMNKPGETVSFEVNGLDALTQYYFAVRSIDRWENKSDFSNEITTTTNAGPDAWIDKSDWPFKRTYIGRDPETNMSLYDTTYYLPLTINVQTDVTGSNNFYLHNSGEGVLRYDVLSRHVATEGAYSVNDGRYIGITYPEEYIPPVTYNPNITTVLADNFPVQFSQEENNEWFDYTDPWKSYYYLGETDTSFTNSSATRFQVDQLEGFNLTSVDALLNYENASNEAPAILEVYLGENIADAQLTYAQELTDLDRGWNLIQLEEQIFLENGMYFWIVIHVPSGNLFPLGGGLEKNPEDSKNCYMSLNMGRSWILFEDLYYHNEIVWAVAPGSQYKTMGDYISIAPESGEVLTDDSVSISGSLDASEFINGTYKSTFVVNTNETGEPQLRAPFWVEVEGHKAVIEGEAVIDFGSVTYGNEKIVEVTLKNNGYGQFRYARIAIDNPDFTRAGTSSTSLGTINSRSEMTFPLLFKPSGIGNSNASVRIYNSYGDEFNFFLSGVGAEPPVMELKEDTTQFNNITIGDTLSGDFYVKNTGNYPLSYYLPTFVESSIGNSTDVHKFGYSVQHNDGGLLTMPAMDWIDISETGTPVTGYSRDDADLWYYPVELGFNFPFFGDLENELYITNMGIVSFDMNSVFNSKPPKFKDKNKYNPDRYISAIGYPFILDFGGSVYYQDLGDRFIVQYHEVIFKTYDASWNETEVPVSIQIVLHSDGDISMYYKGFTGIRERDLQGALVCIETYLDEDGLLVTDNHNQNMLIGDGTVVEFTNPGLGLIYELTNPEGTIQAGDSVLIEYSAKTEILNEGRHIEKVPVLSNDPFNNPGIYTLDIDVTEGGIADLQTDLINHDFGQIFQTDTTAVINMWMVNKGSRNDTLTTATFDYGYFTFDATLPAVVTPNRKVLAKIQFNTSTIGVYSDTLRLSTASGRTFNIGLDGEVIDAPVMLVSLDTIADTLDYGTAKTLPMTIENTGGNPLDVNLVGNDWITISEPSTMSLDVPEFTYHVTDNRNADHPVYLWEELQVSGTKIDSLEAWELGGGSFWSKPIELPFSFNFYGIDYDTLWVGYNGVLTFTENDDIWPFGYGATFPNTREPDNLIAPAWGFFYDYGYSYEHTGVYYKLEADKAIFEWLNFGDGFSMGDAISFQAILYADGRIKFQYNMENIASNENEALTSLALIGIENEDGMEGITFAKSVNGIVKHENAIVFTPAQKYTIPVGETKNFDLTLSAENIYAGDYSADIHILNNQPNLSVVEIPVDLHVNGDAVIDAPDSIGFGEIMVVGEPYVQEFTVNNTGSASFEVKEFNINGLNNVQVEAFVFIPDWRGNYNWTWYQVSNLPAWDYSTWPAVQVPLMVEPNSSLQLRASLDPSTAEPVRDTMLFITDWSVEDTLEITFAADPYLPPSMTIAETGIDVYAQTQAHQETQTVYISNKEGNSGLEYNIEIVYERAAVASANKSQTSPLTNVESAPLVAQAVNSLQAVVSATETFNRTLDHTNADAPDNILGYGGSLMFASATKFMAPGDGFNLTHVSTWYAPGDWLESVITVEILSGTEFVADADVLYTETFEYNVDQADGAGKYVTFELTKNKLFFPNEEFYVVFKYPVAANYPQGTALVSEQVERRFWYGDGEQWFDIMNSQFEDKGWMVKALEAEYQSAVWVEISSATEGIVSEGDSIGMEISFNAGYANRGINKAEVIISSNDPSNAEYNLPVSLHLNQGPVFELGTEMVASVDENASITLQINAEDLEGDNFTLALAEAHALVEELFSDGTLTLTYSPDYESAGAQIFTINGTDEFDNTNIFVLTVVVNDVNRAPEALPVSAIEMTENGENHYLSLSEMFVDLDGDLFDFDSAVSSNGEVTQVFESNGDFVFVPGVTGSADVTVYASDIHGASASNTLTFNVVKVSGVNEFGQDEMTIYPNPTSGKIYIEIPTLEGEFTVSILNTVGETVKTDYISNTTETLSIDLSEMPEGYYFIKLENEDRSLIKRVVKK